MANIQVHSRKKENVFVSAMRKKHAFIQLKLVLFRVISMFGINEVRIFCDLLRLKTFSLFKCKTNWEKTLEENNSEQDSLNVNWWRL